MDRWGLLSLLQQFFLPYPLLLLSMGAKDPNFPFFGGLTKPFAKIPINLFICVFSTWPCALGLSPKKGIQIFLFLYLVYLNYFECPTCMSSAVACWHLHLVTVHPVKELPICMFHKQPSAITHTHSHSHTGRERMSERQLSGGLVASVCVYGGLIELLDHSLSPFSSVHSHLC